MPTTSIEAFGRPEVYSPAARISTVTAYQHYEQAAVIERTVSPIPSLQSKS